jgi:hypothetical protein
MKNIRVAIHVVHWKPGFVHRQNVLESLVVNEVKVFGSPRFALSEYSLIVGLFQEPGDGTIRISDALLSVPECLCSPKISAH